MSLKNSASFTFVKFILLTAVFGFIISLFTTILVTSPSTQAATFDSDLLPDVTNSRNIGTLTGALKTWKNLFLTGVLSLGTATDAQETGVTTATGGLYFNTTGNNLKVYNGTTWQNVGSSQTPWTQHINAAGFTLSGDSIASGILRLDSTSHATKGYILLNPTGGNVGIGVATPGAKLDVAGGIKLANDTATCDSTKAGTLRWTGINFSGCNGTTWVTYATLSTPIEYLVVAGGGSGRSGGPGGAGGFIEGSLSLTIGSYSVVVGAGGPDNTNGSNSTFGGVTAFGGGKSRATGGSGGGTNEDNTTYASTQTSNGGGIGYGSSGRGNLGGQDGGFGYAAGGGGGAGGDGSLGSTNYTGGNGGPGRSSSISGTSVCYAGGGGGGAKHNGGTVNPGEGTCGGGDGGADGNFVRASTAGVPNTGGGGGGRNYDGASGGESAGGSGIVIIRYLTADAVGKTITGGTVTTSGPYTIRTFTASGNLTITI